MSDTRANLEPEEVELAVRSLLGDPNARVTSWDVCRVDWRVVSDVTAGLCRVHGIAAVRDGAQSWSMIVKTAKPDTSRPTDPGWLREMHAYTSGVLRATRCVRHARVLHVSGPTADRVTLYLEDVPDVTPDVWPLERHLLTARHLGEWNAAHLVHGEGPVWAWRDWLGTMNPRTEASLMAVAASDETWASPLVQEVLGDEVRACLHLVDAAFDAWSRSLAALPRSLVHLDAGRFNIRAASEHESVLIDFQALGTGPLGADLATAQFLNLCRFYADPFDVEALSAEGFEPYWEAIRAAQVKVSHDEVRFAYAAVAAMRTAIVTRVVLPRLLPGSEDLRLWSGWGRKRGWKAHDALRAWAYGTRGLLRLSDGARRWPATG